MSTQYIDPAGNIGSAAISDGASIDWPNESGGTVSVSVRLFEATVPEGAPLSVATELIAAASRSIEKYNRQGAINGQVCAAKVVFG